MFFVGFYITVSLAQMLKPKGYGAFGGYFNGITVSNNTVIVSSFFDGIFISKDNGVTWQESNSGLTSFSMNCVGASGGKVFAGSVGGLFISSDDGVTWAPSSAFANQNIRALSVVGSYIFLYAANTGVYRSADNGTTWSLTNLNVGISFTSSNGTLLATDGAASIYSSTDNGMTWSKTTMLDNSGYSTMVAAKGAVVLASTANGAYRSIDNGATWAPINSYPGGFTTTILVMGGNFYLAGPGNFRSDDDGLSFMPLTSLFEPSYLFADLGGLYVSVGSKNVSTSSDDGVTWDKLKTYGGPASDPILGIAAVNNTVIISSVGGLYRSPDGGISWGATTTSPTLNIRGDVKAMGSTFFTYGPTYGIYKSTDDGVSWNAVNNGLTNLSITALEVVGTTLIAGTTNGAYVSYDQGNSWNSTATQGNIVCVAGSGNTLYAAKDANGLFRSLDNGVTWTSVGVTPNTPVTSMVIVGNRLYVGTWTGVLFSTDNGDTWSQFSPKFSNIGIKEMVTNGSVFVFVTNEYNVYSCSGNSYENINPMSYYIDYQLSFNGNVLLAGLNYSNVGSLWTTDLSNLLYMDAFTPSSATVGSTVTITGNNFNAIPSKNTVEFNGYYGTVISATSNTLKVSVPASYGTFPLKLTVNGKTIASLNSFSVIPQITSFSPSAGIIGTMVTIKGHGFDPESSNNNIRFNGQKAYVITSSTNTLTAIVPATTSGPISITVNNVAYLSVNSFSVTPQITRFSPDAGTAGTVVTIFGDGFDYSKPSNNSVKFNGKAAQIQSANAEQILAIVPVSATSGPITVTVSGNGTKSKSLFIVGNPPTPCFSLPPKPSISLEKTSDLTILKSSSPGGNHWFVNGAAISDALDSTLVVEQAGTYTVQVNIQGCLSPLSDPIDVKDLVTGDIQNNSAVELFPNPAMNSITIDLHQLASGPVVIEIYNSVGQSISSEQFNGGGSVEINLTSLSKGIYFAKIQQQDGILLTKKIIKL
jgi:hypothetical protein